MAFELIKGPDSYIEDKERSITLKQKTSYGPEIKIYEMSIKGNVYDVEVRREFSPSEIWHISKVECQEAPEPNIQDEAALALESLQALQAIYLHDPHKIKIELAI